MGGQGLGLRPDQYPLNDNAVASPVWHPIKTSKKVLICGDRNWSNRESIRAWLSKLQDWSFDTVIEGEARGADTIAREEAEAMGFTVLKFPADWARYGRAAGPIRNRQMLDQKPELVVAFHGNIQASRGTADTMKEAERRGIQVILVEE